MLPLLPHVAAGFNLTALLLMIAGGLAGWRRALWWHPRLMGAAVLCGAGFLVCYLTQTALVGHGRFPGDDWVRTLFLVILGTHTPLAMAVVPVIARALWLGWHGRVEAHRWWVRIALPMWIYVAITGLLIYWMLNWLRPG